MFLFLVACLLAFTALLMPLLCGELHKFLVNSWNSLKWLARSICFIPFALKRERTHQFLFFIFDCFALSHFRFVFSLCHISNDSSHFSLFFELFSSHPYLSLLLLYRTVRIILLVHIGAPSTLRISSSLRIDRIVIMICFRLNRIFGWLLFAAFVAVIVLDFDIFTSVC